MPDKPPLRPSLDPEIADAPPWSHALTPYDEANLVTYVRLLDAEADGADWWEAARIVLHRDPDQPGAHQCWKTHLERAQWMAAQGYRHLLDAPGAPMPPEGT